MYIRALFTQAEGADDVLSFPPIIGERYTRRYAPGDPSRRRRKRRPRFQLHRWTNIAARCTYAIVYTRCHMGRCYPHHHLLLSFNLPSPLTEDAQRLFLLLTRTRHTPSSCRCEYGKRFLIRNGKTRRNIFFVVVRERCFRIVADFYLAEQEAKLRFVDLCVKLSRGDDICIVRSGDRLRFQL